MGDFMEKLKVLFVCVHNSARSQMAEAFLNHLGGENFIAESAGLEPGKLNPRAVRAMKEIGIDIAGHKTKSVLDFLKNGRQYDYVITLCDETSGERCPVFPGKTIRFHWTFEDPSALTGTEEQILDGTRKIRDLIKSRIKQFMAEI
jgi:arsenate reductase